MILTPGQTIALKLLASSPLKDKFYWTGGTLLSYHYLQHRLSLDLDFFTETPFSFEEISTFIENLKFRGEFKKVKYEKIYDRWEILYENHEDKLRIEFVYYNHEKKTLGKRELFLGVLIDSLEDIAANKTMAYFDRNEPKDLFDIYFLINKAKFTPRKLLELVKCKFGVRFDLALFWSEAFKGLPLFYTLSPLLLINSETEKEILLQKVATYFKTESSKYLRSKLR